MKKIIAPQSGKLIVHGSSVAFPGKGAVLMRGASGSGKSDLAFRLMALGGELLADDQVQCERRRDEVFAGAVAEIRGLIELRGVGLVKVEAGLPAPLRLAIDLVDRDEVERLPDWGDAEILGVMLPRIALHAFDASTPLKILKALEICAKPDLLVK